MPSVDSERIGSAISGFGLILFALAYGHATILLGTAPPTSHLAAATVGTLLWGIADWRWRSGLAVISTLAATILFVSHLLLLLDPLLNGYERLALGLVGGVVLVVGGISAFRRLRGKVSNNTHDVETVKPNQ